MEFQAGDVIEAKGNLGYIDFEGKIEIITITDFERAIEYQEYFLDWWFGEKDKYYNQCKEAIEKVYIGRCLEKNHIAEKGKVVAFAEEFLDLRKTRKVNPNQREEKRNAKNSPCEGNQ